jgi:hypothetical protein
MPQCTSTQHNNNKKRNPKDSTKKPLDLMNTFSEVTGYENNIKKSVDFVYTVINRW